MRWFKKFLNWLGIAIKPQSSQKSLPKADVVHLNDLSDWLEIKEKELILNANLDSALLDYVNKLKDWRWFLECKLDEWESRMKNAGVRDDDARSIIFDSRGLLGKFTFRDEPTIRSIIRTNSHLDEHLQILIEKTEDSNFATNYSYILGPEDDSTMNPLFKELIKLNKFKENFSQRITESGWDKLGSLQKRVLSIEEIKDKMKKVSNSLRIKEERLKMSRGKEDEKLTKLTSLKEEADILGFSDLKSKEKEFKENLEELDDEVFSFFSKLKPLFRDGMKHFSDKLTNDYLENSMNIFYEDTELRVITTLLRFREMLLDNKMSYSVDETNSFLALIEKARTGYLKDLQRKVLDLKSQLKSIAKSAKDDESLKKLEEAKYRVEHFSKQAEILQREADELKEEIKDMVALQNREIELFRNLVKVTLNEELIVKV